jgi:hypothetical protein
MKNNFCFTMDSDSKSICLKAITMVIGLLTVFILPALNQVSMPAAITISPANATGWDQITITYDPSKGCTPSSSISLVGSPVVKLHSAAFIYDNFASWPSWGQYLVNYDQTPNDGIHATTDFSANGDGTYSITMVPAKYYAVPAGKTIIGLTLVFNNGSWAGQGKDFINAVCDNFYLPLKYKDPNHQASQAFKYQAVARDAQNNLITNTAIGVQISILQGTSTGPVAYTETHNPTTNGYGLFNLEMGRGTPGTGNFSSIDWSTGAYFINVAIDPSNGTNYISMGTSELLSVPYAIYAENAGGSGGLSAWNDGSSGLTTMGQVGIGTSKPAGMLAVQGNSSIPVDSALFAVKDKTGFTVFAIYEGGAELYIKPGAKGAKGGFAVGGRSPSKGAPQDLMMITPDSIRITLNDPVAKGAKGGFTVGGRTPGAKGTVSSFTTLTKENYFIGHLSGSLITSGLYNSVLGYQSGVNLSSGSSNSFIGYQSGYSDVDGVGNLFLGYQSGYSNISGNYNSFLGYKSGYSNLFGRSNTFLGSFAGFNNTVGSFNAFIGDSSGISNTLGRSNSFFGTKTGLNNIGGSFNVFIGNKSGFNNTYGFNNVFIGDSAGFYELDGQQNIYIGNQSGFKSTTPWGNIFIGFLSGYNNTTGAANVFVGARTGYSNTTSVSNTFIGIEAGYSVADGCCNTFMGDHAGYYPKTAHNDVFLGAYAGYHAVQDSSFSQDNVFLGFQSGYNSVTGGSNVFVGTHSGFSNVNSFNNVFLGFNSGYSNQTGSGNVFVGRLSGFANTNGYNNVIIGNQAGTNNTTGFENVIIGNASGAMLQGAIGNVMIGTFSGGSAVSGDNNVYLGMHTAQNSISGTRNTILGAWSGADSTLGVDNVFVGHAISRHSVGSRNIYIGNYAGFNDINGTDNVFIGHGAGYNETSSGKLYIANTGTSIPLIYGDFTAGALVINGNNPNGYKFWVQGAAGGTSTWNSLSDARYKKNIVNLQGALEKVLALQGVKFEWIDSLSFGKGAQIGFIAQDVEKIVPELISKSNEGFYTMKYAEVNALLVEAVKEQQKQIEALNAENKKMHSDLDQLKSLQDQINDLKSSLKK